MMFGKRRGKDHGTSANSEVRKNAAPPADGLSDTERRLRDQFYIDPVIEPEEDDEDDDDLDISSMLRPAVRAPQLYKQLAAYGHQEGWIRDPEKYPLMYALLYNATDTAQGVYWRCQERMAKDDNDHSGALKLTLMWCVYVAMADAYYCHQDWDDLRRAGLIYKLENTCGFDNVDDFVEETLHINNEDELRRHIVKLCEIARKPWEGCGSVARIAQATESMTAMYYYGIELGMQYLGLL